MRLDRSYCVNKRTGEKVCSSHATRDDDNGSPARCAGADWTVVQHSQDCPRNDRLGMAIGTQRQAQRAAQLVVEDPMAGGWAPAPRLSSVLPRSFALCARWGGCTPVQRAAGGW